MNAAERGRRGEEIAAAYLQLAGYRIAARNLRSGPLEIDLVAQRGEIVALVEVRLRSSSLHGRPEESVGRRKRACLRAAAEALARRGLLPEGRLRVDLIAIESREPCLELRHIAGRGGPESFR